MQHCSPAYFVYPMKCRSKVPLHYIEINVMPPTIEQKLVILDKITSKASEKKTLRWAYEVLSASPGESLKQVQEKHIFLSRAIHPALNPDRRARKAWNVLKRAYRKVESVYDTPPLETGCSLKLTLSYPKF